MKVKNAMLVNPNICHAREGEEGKDRRAWLGDVQNCYHLVKNGRGPVLPKILI